MAWHNDQVSDKETEKIIEIARDAFSIPGDFVEFGCYKGDTSLLLAEVLRECGKLVENSDGVGLSNESGKTEKRLWIYDSFEGLPEKRSEDESALGVNFKEGELFVTKREVKERFLKAGLRVPIIKKAWFSDLGDADLPERISFAFLDGDFYESIKDSLKLVMPRMADGGVIVVHDYNNASLPGVAKAVKEVFGGNSGEVYQSMLIVYV